MNNIKVTLLHHTPLYISADGARTCWASQDKSDTAEALDQAVEQYCDSADIAWQDAELILKPTTIGPKDLALIDRVGNQFHHASILEHISMNFFIDGISRACLQELARHRIASLSVKSTRYTLKELKEELPFTDLNKEQARADKYLVSVSHDLTNYFNFVALDNVRKLLEQGTSNDIAKYSLPEAYRTQLTWSINLRSLQNFLTLRTSKKALPEIQHLAHLIYAALPANIQSLVAHCVDPVDELTIAKARIMELEKQLKQFN